jgi:hypothetical protein
MYSHGCYAVITVPYIVTFSAECDVTAAIATEQEHPHLLDRGLGGGAEVLPVEF